MRHKRWGSPAFVGADVGATRRRASFALLIGALSAFVFAGFAAGSAASQRAVPPVDLGSLGGSYSYAVAINASGQVVGNSFVSGDTATHAFLWTKQGGMIDLGTLGGTSSLATAITPSGQIVGESDTVGNGARHAALWQGG